MKYYSEDLKKFFDTAEACEKAEREKKALEQNKEKRYAKVMAARDTYISLRDKYIEDYGEFSTTSSKEIDAPELIRWLIGK